MLLIAVGSGLPGRFSQSRPRVRLPGRLAEVVALIAQTALMGSARPTIEQQKHRHSAADSPVTA